MILQAKKTCVLITTTTITAKKNLIVDSFVLFSNHWVFVYYEFFFVSLSIVSVLFHWYRFHLHITLFSLFMHNYKQLGKLISDIFGKFEIIEEILCIFCNLCELSLNQSKRNLIFHFTSMIITFILLFFFSLKACNPLNCVTKM